MKDRSLVACIAVAVVACILACWYVVDAEKRGALARAENWQNKVNSMRAAGWRVVDLGNSMIVTDPATGQRHTVTFDVCGTAALS